MTAPVLSVRGLVKRFPARVPGGRPHEAVRAVDLEVRAGEVVGLVGESGSGKTTLGKAMLRIVEPDAGSIHLLGQDLRALAPAALRASRRHAQMIHQSASASLNPGMTVREHLEETLALHRSDLVPRADAVVEETLARFRLEGKADRLPGALSGGERRRVGLARCLLPEPALVVADEPTAGLDASVKADVLRVMLEARRPEQAFVFVSHELDVVRYVSDRVLVMFRGAIVEELPAAGLQPGASPLHPYAERLLSSSFSAAAAPIRPAGPLVDGAACAYLGACHAATDAVRPRCASVRPALLPVAPGHRLACHLRAPGTA